MGLQYIIVAGVNGAGKSTLYSINPELFENTRRINADEWLKEHHGDWRKEADNVKAMKAVVDDLKKSFNSLESIHHETTLSGTGKPFVNLVNRAHSRGYQVTLLYVYLDSPELAVSRVKDRVSKGGHDVPEEVILKRYYTSLENLSTLVKLVDEVKVYDNTEQFQFIYHSKKDVILLNDLTQDNLCKILFTS